MVRPYYRTQIKVKIILALFDFAIDVVIFLLQKVNDQDMLKKLNKLLIVQRISNHYCLY